ncbi:hypothetical protein MMC13_001445 [Lambiella insularis]|nr:hypothetical protein [Lambiella insularis]
MVQKPIFLVFMTCHDNVVCYHEPFGDSFYYGPERISPTYMHNEVATKKSGFEKSTYDVVLCNILSHAENSNRRVFVKDIAYHIVSPIHTNASVAPSLQRYGTTPVNTKLTNPAVLPPSILCRFQFTFLVRNPSTAIPSLYRCTVPPLSEKTGMHKFLTSEIGYREMRLLVDYLYADNTHSRDEICLIDADDLLEDPAGIVRAYCQRVDLPFNESMLKWGSEEDQARAVKAFAKYYGYHEDAIESTGINPQPNPKRYYRSTAEEDVEWRSKYGEEGAAKIREVVDENMNDYKYLRQFALVPFS